jgi:hypothetical protein
MYKLGALCFYKSSALSPRDLWKETLRIFLEQGFKLGVKLKNHICLRLAMIFLL